MEYLNQMAKRDLISLLEIGNDARMAKDINQWQHCCRKLKSLILFEGALSVYAHRKSLSGHSCPRILYNTMDFSDEFFENYLKGRHYENSTVCRTMFLTWRPQHWKTAWSMDVDRNGVSSRELANAYGYFDGWACAHFHKIDDTLSVIAFAGKKAEHDRRTTAILTYITPCLSEALKRIYHPNLTKDSAAKQVQLTGRELEVLKWITEGKSTWEISVILSRSERVVKWHVKNIKRKLSAQNRPHAVAIAYSQGLMD